MTTLIVVTGAACGCVAGVLTYWIVGQVLTLDPLPWTALVALTTGLVLGRECYESSKNNDSNMDGNIPQT